MKLISPLTNPPLPDDLSRLTPPQRRPRRHRRTLTVVAGALLLTSVVIGMLYGMSTRAVAQVKPPVRPSATATVIAQPTATATAQTALGFQGTPAEIAYVNGLIAKMSLDEEIGQMIVVDFLGTTMTPDLAAKIQQYHVGGAILYDRNITSMAQIRTLTAQMQGMAPIPLLIAADQEGGTVNRLTALEGPQPSAEAVGATNNPDYARKRGAQDAQVMMKAGLNVNLAPVVDVQGVPDSQTYMRKRMFGWTPDKVTTMAGAYLDGLEQSGHVIGTLKHFPGLGAVGANPHTTATVLNHNLADLQSIDWAPYRALLAPNQPVTVGLIMTTHITVPAVDPTTPATLSSPLVTGILRDQLGYEGVIMTDDLYMKGIATHYTFPQRVLGAVQAGHDMICSMFQLGAVQWAEQILRDAVSNGQLSKQRIDDSVRRILLLKLHAGLLTMPPSAPQTSSQPIPQQ